jgi:hypothetical protein
MAPRAATATPSSTAPAANSTTISDAKQKKAPVAWDKDGRDGQNSYRILLDWLAVEGNYERWRGDNKGGATKTALANEILLEMRNAGITHRDAKGIQTKVKELAVSHGKACDFLRGTGAGLMDEDIANGTTTLQGKQSLQLSSI